MADARYLDTGHRGKKAVTAQSCAGHRGGNMPHSAPLLIGDTSHIFTHDQEHWPLKVFRNFAVIFAIFGEDANSTFTFKEY